MLARDALFLARTLRLLLPGSRYRRLRRYANPDYKHERDKHPLRNKHFGDQGWKVDNTPDGFRYREYGSYEEYVEHQRQKILEILKANGGFNLKVVLRQRYDFWQRFRKLSLPSDASILCLGARFGTEVEVLRDLGYRNALGTDLEPGPENPYVVVGDFMNIDAADASVDMIYCNAVDHAFDLDRFFREHARVLKPDGIAIYDISTAPPGSFEAVEWNDERSLFLLMLEHFSQVESVRIDRFWKTIRLRGRCYRAAEAASDEPGMEAIRRP